MSKPFGGVDRVRDYDAHAVVWSVDQRAELQRPLAVKIDLTSVDALGMFDTIPRFPLGQSQAPRDCASPIQNVHISGVFRQFRENLLIGKALRRHVELTARDQGRNFSDDGAERRCVLVHPELH
jgi:hypothetical protein